MGKKPYNFTFNKRSVRSSNHFIKKMHFNDISDDLYKDDVNERLSLY